MDIDKIAKNITADYSDYDNPRVYVGTYAKYNDGNLKGQWVDLDDFNDKEQFLAYCAEIHSDEADPEFMFQDYENFPEEYYSESEIKPELWDYIDVIKTHDKDLVDAVVDAGYDLDKIDNFVYYSDCNSDSDLAYAYVQEIGGIENLSPELLQNYFDYDSFGRDLKIDAATVIEYNGGYLVRWY